MLHLVFKQARGALFGLQPLLQNCLIKGLPFTCLQMPGRLSRGVKPARWGRVFPGGEPERRQL